MLDSDRMDMHTMVFDYEVEAAVNCREILIKS